MYIIDDIMGKNNLFSHRTLNDMYKVTDER